MVLLKGQAIWYDTPWNLDEMEAVDRSDFNIPGNGVVFMCAQSMFKLHPDYDKVLAAILQRVPESILVLVEVGRIMKVG